MGTLQASTLIVKFAFAAGVLAALAWFVFRPLFRTWRQQPNPEDLMPKLPDLPDEELQIPVDPNDRPKPTREQMLTALRSDPRATALLLQQSIRQKERGKKSASSK